MPRPARPWFRFYVEAVTDRKLRRRPAAERWLWVAILAAARQSCIPGFLLVSEREPMDEHDLADFAGVAVTVVTRAVPAFERSGMLTRDTNLDCWAVTNWNERQFESDDVTQRTRKHRSREQERNVPTSFPGTPPETETDTDTENPLQTQDPSPWIRADEREISRENGRVAAWAEGLRMPAGEA